MKAILATLIALSSGPLWAADVCYRESLSAALQTQVRISTLEALARGSYRIVNAVNSSRPGYTYAVTVEMNLIDLNGKPYQTVTNIIDVRVVNPTGCKLSTKLNAG